MKSGFSRNLDLGALLVHTLHFIDKEAEVQKKVIYLKSQCKLISKLRLKRMCPNSQCYFCYIIFPPYFTSFGNQCLSTGLGNTVSSE